MSVSLYGSGQTVIQVVSATTNSIFSTTSASFVDITGLTVSITPQSSTSKFLVFANIAGGNASSNVYLNLVRNGTNIAQSTGSTVNATAEFAFPGGYQITTIPINYLDSPSTTSTLTYKMQIACSSGTTYVNSRATDNYYGGVSTITVLEISGS